MVTIDMDYPENCMECGGCQDYSIFNKTNYYCGLLNDNPDISDISEKLPNCPIHKIDIPDNIFKDLWRSARSIENDAEINFRKKLISFLYNLEISNGNN